MTITDPISTPEPPKPQQCAICRRPYAGYGHNAEPYAGRCCDQCNQQVVVPTWLFMLQMLDTVAGKAR